MRMRRKPNLAARMERCAHLLISEPEKYGGRWLSELGYSDLHIELGCGKGRNTIEMAKAEPGILFVALERLADAMIIACERANAESISNIRFIHALADYLTNFFAPGEVSRIYINFCDPWPLQRHAKRRLTSRRFIESYKHVLRPGGEVCFKTDNLPLFEFSLSEFELAGFSASKIVYDLHKDGPVGIMTDYEMRFHDRGLPINMARFVLE